jgi:hypothetical protein
LVDTKEGVKWYNLIDESINLTDIKTLSLEINKMYSLFGKCKNNSNLNKTSELNMENNIKAILCKIKGGNSKLNGSNSYNTNEGISLIKNQIDC